MTPAAPAAAAPTGSLAPTGAQLWRAARGPALVIGAVLLAGVVLATLASGTRSGLLDPRAADPSGSRALAEVLRRQGVEVRLVTTIRAAREAAGPGVTLLVAFPDRLVASQTAAVKDSGADLVLVAPQSPEQFAQGVRLAGPTTPGVRQPVCQLPAATRAGSADAGAFAYEVEGVDADLCYASGGRASLVQVHGGARTVTVLGNEAPLTNDRLDELGNAALALDLLGRHQRLVWYLPSLGDVPAGEARSFYDMLPAGVYWGLAQAAIAVLLLALWRARRLGPVVPEPLPVVVRAAETVEGRARLYRRGGARGKAAAVLRSGARARLVPLLGLPRGAEPAAVVDATAARTRRTAPEIGALLYGAAPPDDAALVRLADALDALEREVRRP
jgi:uncharacterized protein DUF4350